MGIWPDLLPCHRGLMVHLTLGLGGFFGMTVVGVFYRLVPLLHGARVANGRRGWGILVLGVFAMSGTLVGVPGDIGRVLRGAAWCATAALFLFSSEVRYVLTCARRSIVNAHFGAS